MSQSESSHQTTIDTVSSAAIASAFAFARRR
jgi:hypothetical protein